LKIIADKAAEFKGAGWILEETTINRRWKSFWRMTYTIQLAFPIQKIRAREEAGKMVNDCLNSIFNRLFSKESTLEDQLKFAIQNEDYERAAQLRDEMKNNP